MRRSVKRRAYLVYEGWEAQKNRGFIELFEQRGRARGIKFVCCDKAGYRNLTDADLVINRTRDPRVSRWFEQQGIPCVHQSMIVETANDKYETIRYLADRLPREIRETSWCPESRKVCFSDWKDLTGPGCEDKVVKSLHGHGGSEVFLDSDRESWIECLRGQDILVQERVESRSQDLRVYIVGGRIYQAMLRSGQQDFRSNFSLGGRVEPYPLQPSQRQYIEQFIACFPDQSLGMAGMDFIVDSAGNLVFNEVEEMVGCRMLYQYTDLDIVKDYIDWLDAFL